jgi:hypothetical protein
VSIDCIDPLRRREIAEQYRDLERKHGADMAVGLICLAYTLTTKDVAAIVKEERHGREPGTDDGTAEDQA